MSQTIAKRTSAVRTPEVAVGDLIIAACVVGAMTWSDSAGLATEAVMLVVRAAGMLADMSADANDPDGVYWATGQGLLAVPGQEDLLAVRLRLHAERQDRVGLTTEWRAYLRMLAADPWSDGSPSPSMARLWTELGGSGSESIRG